MNKFAKLLFVATSLAPVMGAFTFLSFNQGDPWWMAMSWSLGALALLVISALLICHARKAGQKESVEIKSIKHADSNSLAFLLTYLLPLVAIDRPIFNHLPLAIYVGIVIAWAVYHSNAYHFNPLLGLLGLHFYDLETKDGMTFMLLSRRTFRSTPKLSVTVLFDYTLLDAGDPS